MTLLSNPMTARLVALNAAGKVATAWLMPGGAIESDAWTAELDGTVSCVVDGIRTFFDPEHIIAVRERPSS